MSMIKNIRLIEIEISSYCNRTCGWCPNKDIDRKSFCNFMPIDTYRKILDELESENYTGTISFSRYNEPMAFADRLDLLTNMARSRLPEVRLVSNTNGDFLSEEALSSIAIDELTVMDYDCKGYDYASKKLEDCGCTILSAPSEQTIFASYKKMSILYVLNWPKNAKIGNRGASLDDYNSHTFRSAPCLEPSRFIGIDYNGCVMPCCEVRSDNPDHAPMILGNVSAHTLSEILGRSKSMIFASNCASGIFNKKSCLHCIKEPGRYTRENPGIEMV